MLSALAGFKPDGSDGPAGAGNPALRAALDRAGGHADATAESLVGRYEAPESWVTELVAGWKG